MSAGLQLQISIYLMKPHQKILPFLTQAEKLARSCGPLLWWQRTNWSRACMAGCGRGLSNKAAITAVRRTGRNPYEAVIFAVIRGRNPFKAVGELNTS